ncbi:hypothetical protein LINGRAHAP2_LOCUS24004, partial [Linum grandiflorum]
ISSSFANQPTISSSSLFFSDDYQRRKENHFRSLSISILELELAFGVRSFSVSSFKTYPRSPIRSISFLLRSQKSNRNGVDSQELQLLSIMSQDSNSE